MIPKERIQEVKDKDIVSLCENLGMELSKNGRNYITLCPFHVENKPSFTINPRKNLWYCFGCQNGGDTIKLYMKMKNVNFVKAIDELSTLV